MALESFKLKQWKICPLFSRERDRTGRREGAIKLMVEKRTFDRDARLRRSTEKFDKEKLYYWNALPRSFTKKFYWEALLECSKQRKPSSGNLSLCWNVLMWSGGFVDSWTLNPTWCIEPSSADEAPQFHLSCLTYAASERSWKTITLGENFANFGWKFWPFALKFQPETFH